MWSYPQYAIMDITTPPTQEVHMYKSKNPMLTLPDELVQQIGHVTDHQIDELILLVSRRFNQLRPQRDGIFLSLSQDPQARNKELEEIILSIRLPRA